MQKSRNYKLKLGAAVMFTVIMLLGSIYYISKNQDIFIKSFRLCAVFPDMEGLQIGDHVRFDGINVGEIDGVRILNDSSVMVYFLVEEEMRPFIKKGSKAMISSSGLTGSKVLSIIPGAHNNLVIQHDDTLSTAKPIGVNDILENVKATATNAKLIAENISYISKSMKGKKGLVGKMMNDKKFARNLDSTMTNFKGAKEKLSSSEEDTTSTSEEKKKKRGLNIFRKKENKDTVLDTLKK